MRRFLWTLPLLLMPLAAAGQALSGDTHDLARYLLQQKPDQMAEVEPGVVVPLWRGSDGRMLALKAEKTLPAVDLRSTPGLSFSVVDASTVMSSKLQYGVAPHVQAYAGLSQRSWADSAARVIGSEVGAIYDAGRYSLDLSVATNSIPNSTPSLPRILPGVSPNSVNGLPGFDSSSQLNARGRLALDASSGIDLGASVGRIRLLPGNLLGLNTLDQKALSFGVDRGPLSGSIVGRVIQPEAGVQGLTPNQRWSSIDLGVTWRLPWQGALSIGAQNVWSSGSVTNTPVGPEPDQSRTPYVQYHQDL